jgi:Spy/CpxP family protein refolding chaperone
VDERVQRMSGELNLTPEQTAKVKALLTAEQRAMDSTRAVRAVQWAAERKAMEARHADHEKALMALLTPEQKTKHEALMKARGGPGMMRGRGMGAPGGAPVDGHGMHRGPGGEGAEH